MWVKVPDKHTQMSPAYPMSLKGLEYLDWNSDWCCRKLAFVIFCQLLTSMKRHSAFLHIKRQLSCKVRRTIFLKQMGILGLFVIHLFSVFSNKQCKFYYKLMWKFTSRIWHQDLNSQPSDYESPPLTTRPGLPHDEQSFNPLKGPFDGVISKVRLRCIQCDQMLE